MIEDVVPFVSSEQYSTCTLVFTVLNISPQPVNPLGYFYQKGPQEGPFDKMVLRDLHTLF